MKIGIVVGTFNKGLTDVMVEEAKKTIQKLNLELVEIAEVPGVFDMPIIIKKLLENKKIDAVLCLGVIKKGDTLHDEVIGFSTSKTMQELSIQYNKPVANGIIGPGVTLKQAETRLKDYARRGVEACLKLHQLMNL